MGDILKGVVTTGTPSNFGGQLKGKDGKAIDTAGKTGTTSDDIDKWFCGFTPYYTAATWYGYDNRLRQTKIPSYDYNNAVKIWMWVMKKLHADLPGATFSKPKSIVRVSVCESGYYPTDACKAAGAKIYTDYFVSGSFLCPKENNPCTEHVATPTPAAAPGPDGGGGGQGADRTAVAAARAARTDKNRNKAVYSLQFKAREFILC